MAIFIPPIPLQVNKPFSESLTSDQQSKSDQQAKDVTDKFRNMISDPLVSFGFSLIGLALILAQVIRKR